MFRASILVLAIAVSPGFAAAQTQAQLDRMDRVLKHGIVAPSCAKMGFQFPEDAGGKIIDRVVSDTVASGVDRRAAAQAVSDAVRRSSAVFMREMSPPSTEVGGSDEIRENAMAFALKHAQACAAAAKDPLVGSYLKAPTNFEVTRAARDVADQALAPGGLASWQTPEVQARGNLLLLAGACLRQIGTARSHALARQYGQSDDPRVRAYYAESYEGGQTNPDYQEFRAFHVTQCERGINSFAAKAGG